LAEKIGVAAPSSVQTRSGTDAPMLTAKAVSTEPSVQTTTRKAGLTHPVWEGVSLSRLREWLRWWQDESKAGGRVENGWGREEQIMRISAEIAAREAANRPNLESRSANGQNDDSSRPQ